MKDKDKEDINVTKYDEFYNKAYLKIDKLNNDELDFQDMLFASVVAQDNYSNRSRDIRNIFIANSLNRGGHLKFDNGLPDKIKIWEYYTAMNFEGDKFFEEDEMHLFKDKNQLKIFYISFINRFFKGGVEEYSFFDKIVFNTLIKTKLLIRYDSSLEDILTTAKSFFMTAV